MFTAGIHPFATKFSTETLEGVKTFIKIKITGKWLKSDENVLNRPDVHTRRAAICKKCFNTLVQYDVKMAHYI